MGTIEMLKKILYYRIISVKKQATAIEDAIEKLEALESAEKELPNKKHGADCLEEDCPTCNDVNDGFNACLDLCTPIVARLKQQLAEQQKEMEVLETKWSMENEDATFAIHELANLENQMAEQQKVVDRIDEQGIQDSIFKFHGNAVHKPTIEEIAQAICKYLRGEG